MLDRKNSLSPLFTAAKGNLLDTITSLMSAQCRSLAEIYSPMIDDSLSPQIPERGVLETDNMLPENL